MSRQLQRYLTHACSHIYCIFVTGCRMAKRLETQDYLSLQSDDAGFFYVQLLRPG